MAVLDEWKTRLGQIQEKKKDKKWKAVLDSCKDLLQKSASILHANNIYLVRVLDAAFCAAIEVEKFELAAKYGARTLDPYRLYYGDNSPNVALQLFMVGKIQLYLQDMTTALKSLEMSRKILAVTHGTEHKIYKDVTLFVEQCREELRVQLEKSVS
ncbi:histone-lysine N-methyltransferase SMYD3-like [Dreissena polymorpha]|uniref:histone-lysine N-methyltransferase SMYD3-like n=1 Tax=Dreissena polymorpha TaxID=45954 RepID=UPI0022652F4B|nr:histone-lysine N-methyltransferase SMYD3-like [Dreissena polymorpha]